MQLQLVAVFGTASSVTLSLTRLGQSMGSLHGDLFGSECMSKQQVNEHSTHTSSSTTSPLGLWLACDRLHSSENYTGIANPDPRVPQKEDPRVRTATRFLHGRLSLFPSMEIDAYVLVVHLILWKCVPYCNAHLRGLGWRYWNQL